MPMTRAGEPLAVDGFESVKTIQTLPNTITIAFHKTQNILYRIETDANNHPSYRFFNYSEMETPIDKTRTATLEDLYNMKLVTAQNAIDNANQTQYILGQMGRWVAWAGSGSQTTTAGN